MSRLSQLPNSMTRDHARSSVADQPRGPVNGRLDRRAERGIVRAANVGARRSMKLWVVETIDAA